MRITHQQWVAQWANLDHKLMINEYNFEVMALKEIQELFDDSFDNRSYNDKSWHEWTPKYAEWIRKKSHPGHRMLQETGSLRRSIKSVIEPQDFLGVGVRHSYIHTDPAAFGGSKRNPTGKCYAAVHNNLDKMRIKPSGPLWERQFMGHSEKTRAILLKYERKIFDGFPHKIRTV